MRLIGLAVARVKVGWEWEAWWSEVDRLAGCHL